ncbi:MAG: hypothetical protein EA353_12955 [Puniceicoccaceae bacterium]|nr:MAG: hypothetical protein EA353_12955 [Puniceicoccaceae bacterium]
MVRREKAALSPTRPAVVAVKPPPHGIRVESVVAAGAKQSIAIAQKVAMGRARQGQEILRQHNPAEAPVVVAVMVEKRSKRVVAPLGAARPARVSVVLRILVSGVVAVRSESKSTDPRKAVRLLDLQSVARMQTAARWVRGRAVAARRPSAAAGAVNWGRIYPVAYEIENETD